MVNCIPIELVGTDWPALAAWAGVVVNGLVVAAAFAVQRRQAHSDRNLAERAEKTALSNAITAYGMLASALVDTAAWVAVGDMSKWGDRIAVLQRRLRAVDFYLTQPVPAFSVIDSLIQTRDEALSAIKRIEAVFGSDDNLDDLFRPLNINVLTAEFQKNTECWSDLYAEAQAAHIKLE